MDKDHPHIRSVCKKDAEFLYILMNCPSVLQRLNEVPTEKQDWIDAINEWANDDDEEDYIIFNKDTPVGWLGINGLQNDNRIAYLKMAAILPEYQGQGFGTSAIQEILHNLKSRGIKKVILFTDSDNHMAQACYEKCGFHIVESITDTMSNGKTIPRLRMDTDLS